MTKQAFGSDLNTLSTANSSLFPNSFDEIQVMKNLTLQEFEEEFPVKNSLILVENWEEGNFVSMNMDLSFSLCFLNLFDLWNLNFEMGIIDFVGFCREAKWVVLFKNMGAFSSLTTYITEDWIFDEEEERKGGAQFGRGFPASFGGDKLAGSGGGLAGKGRVMQKT